MWEKLALTTKAWGLLCTDRTPCSFLERSLLHVTEFYGRLSMLRNFFLNIYLYILYGIIYLSIYLSMIVFVIALILSPSALPNISRYAEKNDWLLMLWFAWTASHVTLLNFWFRTRVGEPCWSTSRPAGATPSWPSSACSWPYSYLPGWPQTSGYRFVDCTLFRYICQNSLVQIYSAYLRDVRKLIIFDWLGQMFMSTFCAKYRI